MAVMLVGDLRLEEVEDLLASTIEGELEITD